MLYINDVERQDGIDFKDANFRSRLKWKLLIFTNISVEIPVEYFPYDPIILILPIESVKTMTM